MKNRKSKFMHGKQVYPKREWFAQNQQHAPRQNRTEVCWCCWSGDEIDVLTVHFIYWQLEFSKSWWKSSKFVQNSYSDSITPNNIICDFRWLTKIAFQVLLLRQLFSCQINMHTNRLKRCYILLTIRKNFVLKLMTITIKVHVYNRK